jgi:hypothetical protein
LLHLLRHFWGAPKCLWMRFRAKKKPQKSFDSLRFVRNCLILWRYGRNMNPSLNRRIINMLAKPENPSPRIGFVRFSLIFNSLHSVKEPLCKNRYFS